MNKKWYIIISVLISAALISYLFIHDPVYSTELLFMMMKYLLYVMIFFGIPGFFIICRLPVESVFETLTAALFSGIITVCSITFLWCGITISKVTFTAILIIAFFITVIAAAYNRTFILERLHVFRKDQKNIVQIISCLIIGTVIWYVYTATYFPGDSFIFPTDHWIDHHTTSCWVNATLEITNYTEALKAHEYHAYPTIFDFPPNVTFGNVCISAIFLELFQIAGWRFVYLIQGLFCALFLYFIFLRMNISNTVSLLCSLICSCNPFFLNIMSPDRNVLAVMTACFLCYLYFVSKRNYILFGFVSGFLAATGLRQIPLFISLIFFYLYFFRHRFHFTANKLKLIQYFIALFFGALITILHYKAGILEYTYDAEHNLFGLYSFSYKGLLSYPFIPELCRIPFLAFPPLFNNILMLLRMTGVVFFAISLFGVYALYKNDQRFSLSLAVIFVFYFFMLGTQGDWMNYEKNYPSAMLLFPLFFFFTSGLSELFTKKNIKHSLSCFTIGILIHVSVLQLKTIDFSVDGRIYKLHNIREESTEEFEKNRDLVCDIPLFPDYSKIYFWTRYVKRSWFIEFPINSMKDFQENRRVLRSFHWMRYLNSIFTECFPDKAENIDTMFTCILFSDNSDIFNNVGVFQYQDIPSDLYDVSSKRRHKFCGVLSQDIKMEYFKLYAHSVNVLHVNDSYKDLKPGNFSEPLKIEDYMFKKRDDVFENKLYIGFRDFNRDIFVLIRKTDTMTKYWGGRFNIKNEIGVYKILNRKAVKILYLNNYTAEINKPLLNSGDDLAI